MVKSNQNWFALWLSFLVMVVMFIPYIGYTIKTLDIMEAMSIGYSEVSLLAAVTALVGGLVLPFAGHYVDKYGPKRVIIYGLIILVIGQMIFAVSPNYYIMLFSRMLIGAGVGILIIAPYTMAIVWFEKTKSTGMSVGIMLGTDGIGTLVATYLFSMILLTFDWRIGSLLSCLLLLMIILVALKFLKDPPDFNVVEKSRDSFNIREFLKVLKYRTVIAGFIYVIGLFSVFNLAAYWIPTILIEESGWSDEISGFTASFAPLAGILGAFLFGRLSDNKNKHTPFIVLSSGLSSAIFIGIAIGYLNGHYLIIALLLALAGFFIYGGAAVVYSLVGRDVGHDKAGLANGFVIGGGMIVGGLLVPYLVGSVKDVTGEYTVGFLIIAGYLLIFSILNMFLLRGSKVKSPDSMALQTKKL